MNNNKNNINKNYAFVSEILKYNGKTKLSQKKLAKLVGVTDVTIRSWERGKHAPDAAHLKKLLEVYLKHNAFRQDEEQGEAEALWGLWLPPYHREEDTRVKIPFDEKWFEEELKQIHAPTIQSNLVEEDVNNIRDTATSIEDERKLQEEEASIDASLPLTCDESVTTEVDTKNEDVSTPELPMPSMSSQRAFPLSRRTLLVGLGSFLVGVLVDRAVTEAMSRAEQPETNWIVTGSMQLGRSSFRATTLLNGMVLVEGGRTVEDGYTNESERFDPQRGIWTKTHGMMNEQRAEHTATLLPDGRVLVIGGYAIGVQETAEFYTSTTDTWTLSKHTMRVPRTRHTATLLPDGRVLVVGGLNNSAHATTELYDVAHDRWTSAGTMITPRMDHVAVRLYDGRILVAGGTTANDGHSCTSKAEVYDPRMNAWTAIPDMKMERAYFTAILLPDGRVQIIGGRLPDYRTTATTEIYNPFTDSWSLSASMHYGRQNPRGSDALLLANGTIFVAGGDTSGTSEVYLPTKDTWVSLRSLHNTHYICSTALLNHGCVLVAGGLDAFADESAGNHQTTSTEIDTL